MLVSIATGIAADVGYVHGFLQLLRFGCRPLYLRQLAKQFVARNPHRRADFSDGSAISLDVGLFSPANNLVENGFAVVSQFGGRNFHSMKIPNLTIFTNHSRRQGGSFSSAISGSMRSPKSWNIMLRPPGRAIRGKRPWDGGPLQPQVECVRSKLSPDPPCTIS
jgi:hypothetical protein